MRITCPCCSTVIETPPVGALTRQQGLLLAYIKDYIRDHGGVAPSFQEMMDHLELRSKSGVHRLVQGLKERGHIRVVFNRKRAIELVDGYSYRAVSRGFPVVANVG